MIRAAVPAKGGGVIVLLGITPRNVEKLKDGDPMYLDLAELGAPGVKLTIFGPPASSSPPPPRTASAPSRPNTADVGRRRDVPTAG
jgi:hypothetical protein